MKKIIAFTLMAVLCVCYGVLASIEPFVQATINVYPTQLQPGHSGYIQITLRNTGTAPASRVKISAIKTDAPIVSEDWVSELGSLNPGGTLNVVLKFSVSSNASPGIYLITFTIDYCQDSICKTIYPSAILNIQKPVSIEVYSVSPSTLKLGEKTNLTFTIINKGESISNAVFTWTSANNVLLPIGLANRVTIPSIPANSYYQIRSEVAVSPSAIPGVYPLSISLQYIDRLGMNQSVTSVAGIEISGETDFDVSLQDYMSGVATLAIANIGSNTAYSTVVRIPQQEGFTPIGASSSILGNLNAGDYVLTNFQLIPKSNASSRLLVEISYTDLLGVRRNVQKEVEVFVTNGNIRTRTTPVIRPITSDSLIYIAIGIIGIVCIVVAIKLRKRVKKK